MQPSMIDFSSYAGPGDKMLPNSEIRGYQPVSRIGEIVTNAFVDSYEFQKLPDVIDLPNVAKYEHRPHFHEWCTVTPGMICVSRKKRTSVFRQFVAAETAAPDIACAACKKENDERDYFFAGVARSKSIREIDDGLGPSTDEFFTISMGGMATVLNTSATTIFPGELLEWSFKDQRDDRAVGKRQKTGPRRITIAVATVSSAKLIGRALTLAKPGEPLDLLLKQ